MYYNFKHGTAFNLVKYFQKFFCSAGGATLSDEKELFDELEMLVNLQPHPHPNIVNLIGGSTTSDGKLSV